MRARENPLNLWRNPLDKPGNAQGKVDLMLPFQEAVFVNLRLDAGGEILHRGAKVGKQFGVSCVGRFAVHLRLAARVNGRSLEVELDVVEG